MNPILQRMNQKQNNNDMINDLLTGDPNRMFNNLMRSNPQFADFVTKNKNKTAEQIAREYGVDLGAIKHILK